MTLSLSPPELAQLEVTLATLLSPLQYPDVDAWRAAVRRDVEALVGADHSVFICPGTGGALISCDPILAASAIAYEQYYARLDTGLHVHRRELGLEVVHVSDLYDMAVHRQTEFYTDFTIPTRTFDSLALVFDRRPGEMGVSLHCYHDREATPGFGARGRAIFQLLHPAFKAGIVSLGHLGTHRTNLVRVLDQLATAVLILDRAGRVLHRSVALERLLAEEPEGARLVGTMAATAGAVVRGIESGARRPGRDVSPGPVARDVRTRRWRYHLTALAAGAELLGPQETLLVIAEREGVKWPDVDELAARWHLTPMQARVALRLAQGHSITATATAFGLSPHTIRRHAEALRAKLGISRAVEVAARILSDNR